MSVIFFVDIILSFIWGLATIVCLTENMIVIAVVDLVLCIVWSSMAIIWQYKRMKQQNNY